MHGWSSSEESEDPRRPKASAAANNGSDDKKKKKKPKVAPQAFINNIWRTFEKRKFSKALSIFPFDPVAPPAGSERPNELLSAGYERAAEECRRKVQKIIKECRRVNTRYRDPGWDLDWDLKWEKGHCLNALGSTKWPVNRSSLASPNATVPKAVKRVHEIFEKPTFLKNPSANDIKQGSLGDCWLIACMTALANVPGALERVCVEYDTRIGIYGFVFYRDGEWIYSIIDDKLYLKSPAWNSRSVQRDLLQQIDREDQEQVYRKTYQTGSKALFFAQCKDQNETWVPLLEKAYAKAHNDYASLNGGWTGEALEDLTGGVTTEMLVGDILDLDGFWDNELSKVNDEFMFGCSTGLLECGYGDRDGISEGHAYILMESKTLKSGERLLKLRNPWGKVRKGIWEGAWSDGSKEWTPDAVEEVGHQFGSDSSFWISYEDFLNKFQHIDRTRLFKDPNWRCSQRWIGVDVPWKAQYHEKFQIKLTKDSPLVLSLSQLDSRFFRGLTGQYIFRMHFRIHEKTGPDAEDYIVRSHGNYLMDRSIAIELPDMPAGEYSVFISVTAERDTDLPSVESVVKRECKGRAENEKLAQVGQAYDLAHSKGAAHLQEVARLRELKEQAKASGMRQGERRKAWERRHLNRQVTKLQKEKNEVKLARHQARLDEKKRLDDELKPKDQSCQTEEAAAGAEEDKAQAAAEVETKKAEKPKAKTSSSSSRSSSPRKKLPRKKVLAEDEGDSSDSPIEDWEVLYSDDDLVRKPRLQPAGAPKTRAAIYESEDEDAPDPWNAVCILGARVYSMDEGLELRVVMEGGDLAEGGMGKKGEADLDNAQANAGGERERDVEGVAAEAVSAVAVPAEKAPASAEKAPDVQVIETKTEEIKTEVKLEEKAAVPVEDKVPEIQVETKTAEAKPEEPKVADEHKAQPADATADAADAADAADDARSEGSSDSADYDKLDSGASTPEMITPVATPLDTDRELA